jgi:hypothetical protein
MKTKLITGIKKSTGKGIALMAVLGLSLLAYRPAQAQDQNPPSVTPQQLDDNAVSGITNGMGVSQGGKGGFWGYAFGDYAWMANGDSAGRGTKQQYKGLGMAGQNSHPNAMEIRRAYLGYDYNPDKKFSGCVLLAYEGDQDVNDNRTMYMKYAYIKWKGIFKGSDLRIGQMATNSFADAYNTEPLLSYRSVEKTIMDIHGMDASSDMGVYLGGKIIKFKSADSTKFPSFIGYSAMIGDNAANNPVPYFTNAIATSLIGSSISPSGSIILNPYSYKLDNAKKFRGHVYFNTLNGALTVGAYGDFINYGNFYYNNKAYLHQVYTAKVYAVYNSKWFGGGFEAVQQTATNGEGVTAAKGGTGTTDTISAVQEGISTFAHATLIQNTLNVFARFDYYVPDAQYAYNYNSSIKAPNESYNSFGFGNVTGSNISYTETFINVGLDWTPIKSKRVHLMPNVWYYGIKNAYGSDNLAASSYLLYRISFLYAF